VSWRWVEAESRGGSGEGEGRATWIRTTWGVVCVSDDGINEEMEREVTHLSSQFGIAIQ
jgi:hypothetical protein